MKKNKCNISFDEQFHSEFAKNNWEKKPLHLEKVQSSLLQIDQNTIFHWLVDYSEYCKKTKTSEGLKFYINGESQYQDEVFQALPLRKDKSLLGYHQRMSQLFSDYCLVCDELVQFSGEKWSIIGEFLDQLFAQIGLPNRPSEMGLYLGNYQKTPFGVHVDSCSVFSIPIVGEKIFRLWTSEYVKKNPGLELSHEYKQYLKKSTKIVARPGDLVYWPSTSWHIAESDGSFSATWSLGIWIDQPHIDILMQMIRSNLQSQLKEASNSKFTSFKKPLEKKGFVQKLPTQWNTSIELMVGQTKKQWQDLFLQSWLNINSKKGFKSSVRRKEKLRLKKSDWLIGHKGYPILWTILSDKKVYISHQGFGQIFSKTKGLVRLLQLINSGKKIHIASELMKIKTKIEKDKIFQLLESLYQVQALTQVVLLK